MEDLVKQLLDRKNPGFARTMGRAKLIRSIFLRLSNEPLTQSEIGSEFEIAGATVRKHLKAMMKAGVVYQIGEITNVRGHAVQYSATHDKKLYEFFLDSIEDALGIGKEKRERSAWITKQSMISSPSLPQQKFTAVVVRRDPLTAALFGA